jgi:hypothetical protein
VQSWTFQYLSSCLLETLLSLSFVEDAGSTIDPRSSAKRISVERCPLWLVVGVKGTAGGSTATTD